jgi:hypothetical protein
MRGNSFQKRVLSLRENHQGFETTVHQEKEVCGFEECPKMIEQYQSIHQRELKLEPMNIAL